MTKHFPTFVASGAVLLLVATAQSHAAPSAAVARAMANCVLASAISQTPVDWEGDVSEFWDVDANWSTNAIPVEDDPVRHPAGATGSTTIQYGPGVNDPGIASFEGAIPGSGNRMLHLTDSQTLTTKGKMFRSGSGTGAYAIRIDADGAIRVGDPLVDFGGPFSADLYGFNLHLAGDPAANPPQPANVHVSETMGWGALDVGGGEYGFVTAGVAGNSSFPGTIDCAYAGSTQVDPVTYSQWTVDGTTTPARLVVTAGSILNVGNWDFRPRTEVCTNSVPYLCNQVTADVLEAWSDGGIIKIGDTGLAINSSITFTGSSQFVHYNDTTENATGNFLYLGTGAVAPKLSFSDAQSLLRPDSYPQPAPANSLAIYSTGVTATQPAVIEVRTTVGHADLGLAFDGAYTSFFPTVALYAEAYTPDSCNLIVIDHLYDDGNSEDPHYICAPKYNRCAKYWRDVLGIGGTVPVELADEFNNQLPDYCPQDPTSQEERFPEAAYFCDLREVAFSGTPNPYAWTPNGTGPAKLIRSRYGDLQGDFDVDLEDWARFANSFTASGGVTWFPLADWGNTASDPEADCDVDLDDYAVFYERWQTGTSGVTHVCDAPPSQADHGSTSTIVCGGPFHTRPSTAPDLVCPDVCPYTPALCNEGDLSSMSMANSAGGEGGGDSVSDDASPAEIAAWLTAHLSSAERAEVAATLLADTAEADAVALGEILAGS